MVWDDIVADGDEQDINEWNTMITKIKEYLRNHPLDAPLEADDGLHVTWDHAAQTWVLAGVPLPATIAEVLTDHDKETHDALGIVAAAHKDSHDPEDGGDKLDTAAAEEIAGVQAAGAGSSHSLSRADHAHAIAHGITDNHLVTIDSETVANAEYAKFTANGLESKSIAEVKEDLAIVEADIGDLYHDAQKIKGKTVDAPEAGDDDKFLQYDHGNSKFILATLPGGGDMLKSTYDPDDDGIIEGAQLDLSKIPALSPVGMATDTDYLDLAGGTDFYSAVIRLYSKNHAVYPGTMILYVPDAAKTAALPLMVIAGVTDNPYMQIGYGGIHVDTLSEKTAAHGIEIDSLTIKDAGFALGSDADGDIYQRASGALARLAKGTAYQRLRMNSGATTQEYADEIITIPFIINGIGAAITTGYKGHLEVAFGGTITQVTALADQSGSIVVDIWKCSYADFDIATHPVDGDSITAAAPVTISAAVKSQDSTLTAWTTAITAGDILAFNVDSCTDIEQLTISLRVTKH